MAEAVAQRVCTLHIPDSEEGDLRYEWDPTNETQVAVARDAFNNARGRGMVAYRMGAEGTRGEVIREFDPAAESILMASPMAGG